MLILRIVGFEILNSRCGTSKKHRIFEHFLGFEGQASLRKWLEDARFQQDPEDVSAWNRKADKSHNLHCLLPGSIKTPGVEEMYASVVESNQSSDVTIVEESLAAPLV